LNAPDPMSNEQAVGLFFFYFFVTLWVFLKQCVYY
jgi:hypothetical protein